MKNKKNQAALHGVMVKVFNLGVLLIGESGVGKSECALSLISRGHQLIADDLVPLTCVNNTIWAHTHSKANHHMQILGVGIIDITKIFSPRHVLKKHSVDLVIELERAIPRVTYELLGDHNHYHTILGKKLPYLKIPVTPAKDLATIVEVAVKNHTLKQKGVHSAKLFLKT